MALSFWGIPTSSVAQTEVQKFDLKQIELAKESVIYKTDAPIPTPSADAVAEQRPPTIQAGLPKKSVKLVASRPPSRRDYPAQTADKEAVKQLIIQYSNQYGISPDVPLCIAYYESGYNQFSKNKSSSASGVFQYLNGTWKGTDEGKAGLSVFDADANVRAAVKYMASRRSTQPWEVRNKCPKI